MSNQNTRALRIEVALRERWKWIILVFAVRIAPILFLFCNEPAKKNMAYVRLQMNLPTPLIRASTLLAGPFFSWKIYAVLSSFKSTWESSIILTGDANFDTSCSAARDMYEQMHLNTNELPCHVIEPNVKIKGKKFIDHISTNINKIKKHKNTPFRHLTICNQIDKHAPLVQKNFTRTPAPWMKDIEISHLQWYHWLHEAHKNPINEKWQNI